MKKMTLPVLLSGTIIMVVVMATTGAVLKTPQTPYGILNLEFAYSLQHTHAVLNAWQAPAIHHAAILNTLLDFVFLFFYALFLFFSCKKLSTKFSSTHWKYKAGNIFAKAALVTGILDIGENTGMLLTLHYRESDAVAFFTASCAAVKWFLVVLVILYVLLALFSRRQVQTS